MDGRQSRSFYDKMNYQLLINGQQYNAKCLICDKIVKNELDRLETHRNKCAIIGQQKEKKETKKKVNGKNKAAKSRRATLGSSNSNNMMDDDDYSTSSSEEVMVIKSRKQEIVDLSSDDSKPLRVANNTMLPPSIPTSNQQKLLNSYYIVNNNQSNSTGTSTSITPTATTSMNQSSILLRRQSQSSCARPATPFTTATSAPLQQFNRSGNRYEPSQERASFNNSISPEISFFKNMPNNSHSSTQIQQTPKPSLQIQPQIFSYQPNTIMSNATTNLSGIGRAVSIDKQQAEPNANDKKTKESKYSSLGQYISNQLEQLSDEMAIEIELKIHDLIGQAKLKMLRKEDSNMN